MVCIPVLDGTVQVDKDLDDMALGHKMVLHDMVLARRSQCGKVLGHKKDLGGRVLCHRKVGRALDLDDMVLAGRAHTMTVGQD